MRHRLLTNYVINYNEGMNMQNTYSFFRNWNLKKSIIAGILSPFIAFFGYLALMLLYTIFIDVGISGFINNYHQIKLNQQEAINDSRMSLGLQEKPR